MPRPSRRELLRTSALGFGWLALADLLAAAEPAPLRARPGHSTRSPRGRRISRRRRSASSSCSCTAARRRSIRSTTSRCCRATTASRCPFAKPRVVSSADRQPAQVALEVHSSTARAGPGSAICSRTSPRASTTSASSTRCTARTRGTAARCSNCTPERHLRPAEHGLVDHLRPGHREPRPARLHHHLPDADPRRREQLVVGVSARGLPGHAARQRRHPVRARSRSHS